MLWLILALIWPFNAEITVNCFVKSNNTHDKEKFIIMSKVIYHNVVTLCGLQLLFFNFIRMSPSFHYLHLLSASICQFENLSYRVFKHTILLQNNLIYFCLIWFEFNLLRSNQIELN